MASPSFPMAPPPTSPPSSPPSEFGEISPRRQWRRLSPLRVRLGVMMMGERFRRSLLQDVEFLVRKVVRQELEMISYNFITPIPRQLVGGAQHARYHLKFQNKICHSLYTYRKIESEAASDVEIALFDNDKKVIATSDPLSSIKVEVVVLNGDFNNDNRETWSEEEFNKSIALPRDNKGQLLRGERFIKLNNGIGSLGDIAFTDNSSSQKTKKFRLGVRYAQSAPNGERIHEGITEPFRVKERRVESSQKHHTPSLDDEVWRLKHIRKDGIYHETLQNLGIKTVQDFLRCYNLDKGKLQNFLQISGRRMPEGYWKEIVKHARECDPGDKLYSYSMIEKSTVVPVVLFFNSIYLLVGVKFGDNYTTLDSLEADRQDSLESWKNLAYASIKGMQFDHRMINGRPMPLPSSDVTFLPRSSSQPPHLSTFQKRNSDLIDSQDGLLQETSIASKNSLGLFMKPTFIDLDNHQTEQQYTSFAETNNLPLEMSNSSFDDISTPVPNSRFPNLLATHYAPEARYESQTYARGIESLRQPESIVKDASSERDNSLDFTPPMESAPIQPPYYENTAVMEQPFSLSQMSSFDMSLWDELMNSMDMSSFDGLIPASLGGETNRSTAPPSPHPRWVKLLAPIKWVYFTKKRRARILIHQPLVATV